MTRAPAVPGISPRLATTLAIVAVICVLVPYARTLHFGFRYDDYHSLRPWTFAELREVLHGSWDPTHIEVDFYRPFAAWWYALSFAVFGLNGTALHALSLAGLIGCAFMTGLFVWRETTSRTAAWLATALYAIHPSLPYAEGVWLTNQMHLLSSVCVIAALLSWQRARAGSAWDWWPVVAWQLAGLGLKEDTIMLLPLLMVLTVVRRLLVGDVRWPPLAVLASSVAIPLGFFGFRYEILGKLGGYGALPTAARAWDNFTRGLLGVFEIVHAKRPWQPVASVVSEMILVLGGVASVFRKPAASLFLSGLLIAVCFDLPFAIVTKQEQWHLVTLGAVLALTGGATAIISMMPSRWFQMGTTLIIALAFASFVPVTQSLVEDFKPCWPGTLYADAITTEWWAVPPEVRHWLEAKPAACKAGTLIPLPDALDTATWAYGAEQDAQGRWFQWTSDHAVIFANPAVTTIALRIRAPLASAEHPVTVAARGAHATFSSTLTTPDWQSVSFQVSPTFLTSLRQMQRVDLEISPVFVPAEIDPGSHDHRRLGAHIWVESVQKK